MSNVVAHPKLEVMKLAQECRNRVRERYVRESSCIESAFLFERAAGLLGLKVRRVVSQATAMSPLLAQAVADGKDANALMDEPGYWAVAVGMMQSPEDFVGRKDLENNRFVGHVVCLTDSELVDVSADQMSRPGKGLILDGPLTAAYDGQAVVVGFNRHHAVVRYKLHRDVPVPEPMTDRILERMAKSIVQGWRS